MNNELSQGCGPEPEEPELEQLRERMTLKERIQRAEGGDCKQLMRERTLTDTRTRSSKQCSDIRKIALHASGLKDCTTEVVGTLAELGS